MPNLINSIHVKGFRSLADVKIDDLSSVAVLIGTNGSGKSNFIRFFEMMGWMLRSRRLDEFVQRQGGADDQLFGGSKVSPRMDATVTIRTDAGRNDYRFTLAHAHPIVSSSRKRLSDSAGGICRLTHSGNISEAAIRKQKSSKPYNLMNPVGVNPKTAQVLFNLLRNYTAYQFHDTSDGSKFKIRWDVEDNNFLRSDGANLAAILLRLERQDATRFEMICRHVGRVLPGFDRFQIEESYGKVFLAWKAKGMDKTFGAHLTSDGSLRFFALVTLLNLPTDMLPGVILLDEPELGLHPAAITLVGGMIQALGHDKQVIVATQSPLLVDTFSLNEIIVLELQDGETKVRRLDTNEYQHWLEEYTTGELWQKNLLGGRS